MSKRFSSVTRTSIEYSYWLIFDDEGGLRLSRGQVRGPAGGAWSLHGFRHFEPVDASALFAASRNIELNGLLQGLPVAPGAVDIFEAHHRFPRNIRHD